MLLQIFFKNGQQQEWWLCLIFQLMMRKENYCKIIVVSVVIFFSQNEEFIYFVLVSNSRAWPVVCRLQIREDTTSNFVSWFCRDIFDLNKNVQTVSNRGSHLNELFLKKFCSLQFFAVSHSLNGFCFCYTSQIALFWNIKKCMNFFGLDFENISFVLK